MANTVTPLVGANLVSITLAADAAANPALVNSKIGTQVFADDGKIYVYAKANGVIAANTAVCTVAAGTFLATNVGGAYLSPTTAMAVGDFGWFARAGV